MNKSQPSTALTRSFTAALLSLLLFGSCKKESDQSLTPDPVAADSSSISSLIVTCKSSDVSATGFAIIDIQQFFLAKKVVSSTFKGKMFSVRKANEAGFKTVIDKVVLDLQVPEAYFKNYDSFLSIFDERFKATTGFQKSYDFSQSQLDQLFNRQDVSLAFQKGSLKQAFFANAFFVSAGMGSLRLAPLAEIFTLNNFQGLLNVGTKTSGTTANNQSIKTHLGAGASRSTSLTKNDQIVQTSFVSGSSRGSSYSYSYPLPPSPAPVFDAPLWFWHQYALPNGPNFGVVPAGALYDPATDEANRRLLILMSNKLNLDYYSYNPIPNANSGTSVQAIGFGVDNAISSKDIVFLESAKFYHEVRTLANGKPFESYNSQLQMNAPDSAISYTLFKSAVDGTPTATKVLLLKKDYRGDYGTKGGYYPNWINGVWDSTATNFKIFSSKQFLPK